MMLLQATLLFIATALCRNIADGHSHASMHASPSLRNQPEVKSASVGETVEFVCSIASQGAHKVQWWFEKHNQQISSNAEILSDERNKYSIWKPRGDNDVWVLQISNVSSMDAGHYRCDVTNTSLTLTSLLQVTDAVALPRPSTIPRANFTGCCVKSGVPEHCLPICSPATFNMLTYDMERCNDFMPQLLHCGSDGGNHIPCCRRRNVPTLCLDICLGKLPPVINDDHIVCVHRTLDILACFEEGHLLLPRPPEQFMVRTISIVGEPSSSLFYLKWQAPTKNGDTVIGYYVFYQIAGSANYRSTGLILDDFYQLDNLTPGAYNMYVVAVNSHGASLPSYVINVHTPPVGPGAPPSHKVFTDPGYLPDCCRRRGVSPDCMSLLCTNGPSNGPPIPTQQRQELQKCLPEFNRMLPCFAGERNHTDCCLSREVPGVCLPLCGGAPGVARFQLLSCVGHMADISSCVREGYNVIPGPPLDVRLDRVTADEANLEWDPPLYGQAPVKEYLVQYKEKSADAYTKISTPEMRATLTNLKPSTLYTTKVSSLGQNGTSLPSPSLIFLTYSASGGVLRLSTTTVRPSSPPEPQDIARCCQHPGIAPQCRMLCNYDTDFRTISAEAFSFCKHSLHKILQCAVDGRNHTVCCQRRGVRAPCTKFCEFSREDVDRIHMPGMEMCVFEIPKFAQCMKEGIAQLPGPPRQLTVAMTTQHTISLEWLTPRQLPKGLTGYLVEYSTVNTPGPMQPLKTTERHMILQNLDPDTEYVIRVSAYNTYGESLPSEKLIQRTLPLSNTGNNLNFTAPVNIEACCREKHVLPACMPACNNSAPVAYDQCSHELPKLVICSADGRDHSNCCQRRFVPPPCVGFCQGKPPQSPFVMYMCMESLPQILSCFKKGLAVLPSPPRDFHLVDRSSTWLQFSWKKPLKNGDIVAYLLLVNSTTARVRRIDGISTTGYKLDNLSPFRQYSVRVMAVNRYGNSVPSTIIIARTLQEDYLKLSITQAPSGYVREHAASVTLTCQADHYSPFFFIHWLRNGVVHNGSRLTLQGVHRNDTGRYTCVTRNSNGKMYSLDHYIKVQFLPKVVANRTRVSRTPGQVLFVCAFRGYPERISWSRDGRNISGAGGWHERRVITRVIDEKAGIVESRMTIMLVRESDYGTYSCRGENDLGGDEAVLTFKDETEVHIDVYQPTKSYGSLAECCEARGVALKCRAACSFDIDLSVLTSTLRNPLECVGDLPAIILCGADGKDHSQCCRNNSVPAECLAVCAGDVRALTNQHIACIAHIMAISNCMEEGAKNLPSMPQNVRALLSHGYITVRWAPPADNWDKVTFYHVNYRMSTTESALQVKVGPQLREVNLTRIHGHTNYYINVTAGNHHGDSKPSDTLVIKTMELMPSAPRNFTGHVLDDTSVRLSWDKPVKNPGAVLGYLITYAVSGAHARRTENISDLLTYKLDGLTSLTTYTVYVRAESSHFISPSSEVITVTTEDSEGYFEQHFGGTTKVGLGIGLTFAVMVMVIVVGFALFCHMRNRTRSAQQFEDSVAFENPTYTTLGTPRLSGLNCAASTPGSSTELVASCIMKETDSGNSDQGYATLSTMAGRTEQGENAATVHTDATSNA